MEFENHYLEYNEYTQLGGSLQELPFNKLEYECRRLIDEKTLNRLKNATEIPDEVKMCVFKMIEDITTYQSSVENAKKGVSSENIDGYSVSYLSAEQINSAIKSEMTNLETYISTYLFGVIVNNEHLLYIGI